MTGSASGSHVDAGNLWMQVLRMPAGSGHPAIFLDRDGVLVEEINYLHRAADVLLVPGAIAFLAQALALALPVILVTNQAGIGRGYYSWDEFAAVQDAIFAALGPSGAAISAVYACPHHRDARPPYQIADHSHRKPNPGMILQGLQDARAGAARSWIIGDRSSDLDAGRKASLAGGILVATGYGYCAEERARAGCLACPGFKVHFAGSLAEIDLRELA